MKKVLVSYFSLTGNTTKMAEAVAAGARDAGAEVKLKNIKKTSLDDLKWADGIIIGSPTYYGQMAAVVKELFDNSSDIRGQLENKVGAAFTSSASIEGGNQTTLISIIQAMLIHSMIVIGDPMENRWALWGNSRRRAYQRIVSYLPNAWIEGCKASY
ncbi:MAG: NAD(P)H-dependent oxidoreductase [Methanotrichaceae archaeon]|nr:NAD(P)H-dependent oxidoreductase [Methanotrichaceae archaeon]